MCLDKISRLYICRMTREGMYNHQKDCECHVCMIRNHVKKNAYEKKPLNEGITDNELVIIGKQFLRWALRLNTGQNKKLLIPTPLTEEHFSYNVQLYKEKHSL